MKMLRHIMVLVLLLFYTSSLAESKPEGFRFCGKDLANALRRTCAGRGYNSYHSGEDSGSGRRLDSITKTCCANPCTLRTLASYCQGGQASIRESEELLLPVKILERTVRKEPEVDKNSAEEDVQVQVQVERRPFHISFDQAIRNAPIIVTVSPEFTRPAIFPGRM